MIISGTGHRPNYLGGYSDEVLNNLVKVAKQALEELKPEKVISGMAIGWDTALALAALELKIPLIAAVPFIGQESIWNEETQKRYHWILSKAEEVVIVNEGGFAPWKLLKRNVWMNERADAILALYDETKQGGGTAHCVRNALSIKKKIYNCWGIFTGMTDKLTVIGESRELLE